MLYRCRVAIVLLSTIASFAVVPLGLAQDEGDGKVDLGDMVVTPSRDETLLKDTPDIVQVIGRKEIESLNPASMGEIIEYASGVAVETGTGSGFPDRSIVSLNGLPANYTLVLVDGVRLLTEHIHTGQNLNFIPPDSVERIEIIRGAGSAQYGSDAIGGIVNIITRRAVKTPEARVHVSAGSYETYEGGASLLFPADNGVRVSSFLNWEQSDGLPLLAPAHRVDNMGYERFNFLNRVDVDLGEATKLYVSANWVDTTMDWQDDTADSYLITPVLGISQQVSPAMDLHGRVAYSEWDSEVNDERNIFWEPEAYAILDVGEEHTLMGGGNYRWSEFQRRAVMDIPEQTAYGVFVQDAWQASETLSAMAAVRYDKVEDVDGAVSPKLSLMFAPVEDWRVRASYGHGFHAPTLQELYEEGYGHRGTAYRFGNPDLDPEYSQTYALTVEFGAAGPIQAVLHGYFSDLSDMIVPVYEGAWDQDPAIDVWRRTNIKDAEVYGGEATLIYQPTEGTRLEAGYSVTENEDKSTGRQLPYSPGSSVYAKASGLVPATPDVEIGAFVGVRAAFDREAWNWKPAANTDPTNPNGLTTELEDYTKLDAGVNCIVKKDTEFFVKVENILGEDIENLDDAYTVLDGEPVWRVGVKQRLPLGQ